MTEKGPTSKVEFKPFELIITCNQERVSEEIANMAGGYLASILLKPLQGTFRQVSQPISVEIVIDETMSARELQQTETFLSIQTKSTVKVTQRKPKRQPKKKA